MLVVFADREAEEKNSKGKGVKVCEDSYMNEVTGVLQHPCQEQ